MSLTRNFFGGVKKGMALFGETIASLVNSVLLMVVYFTGIGITAIIAKIVGKKFMELKPNSSATYWKDLGIRKRPMKEYYRQF